jgi:hypothetical protein
LAAKPRDPLPESGLRLYHLSRRGGESFEAGGDAARALDAYTFYLHRLKDPELRARLQLHSARAARAACRFEVERRVLLDLFRGPDAFLSEEGLPVSLLAGAMLFERPDEAIAGLSSEAASRVQQAAPRIATPALATFVSILAPRDHHLRYVIEQR